MCRELTAKTSHIFEKTLFTDLTGVFTLQILRRLIDVSRHPVYPRLVKSLTFGHHQLLRVEHAEALWPDGEPITQEYFSNHLMGPAVAGLLGDLPNHSDFLVETRRQAEKFRKAAVQQQEMASIGAEVSMLATALANFPNLKALRLDDYLPDLLGSSHWGARALSAGIGIRHHVPPPLQPAEGLPTPMTQLTNKVLQAQYMHMGAHPGRARLTELCFKSPRDVYYDGPIALQPDMIAEPELQW